MIYNNAQLQSLILSAGVPTSVVPLMAAIAQAESSGNPNAVNDGSGTKSVEYSVGLWQINTRVHKDYTVEQLKNPTINAQQATKIFKSEGLKAWGAYTDGRYKKYYTGATTTIPASAVDTANPSETDNSTLIAVAVIVGLLLVLRD